MTELDVSQLLSVEAATRIVDAADLPRRIIRVAVGEAAGLRLAEEIRCDRDSPPFDKSLMDGFAVRSADLARESADLIPQGKVAAGESARLPIKAGEIMAIMTGAPLPEGADAVVPIEEAEVDRATGRVRILRATSPGRFVTRRGSEAREGDIALGAGTRIGAAQVAVLASVGKDTVLAYDRPAAAVLGNGDELVQIGTKPAGAQIRAANNAMLATLLHRWQCRTTDLGFVRDDPKLIRQSIERGLESDILLISGGMSVGERDYVPGILRELGAEMKITKLRIKPGKPFIFARMPGGKFVFGLPGNPLSAFVCAVTLIRRLIERWSGGEAGEWIRTAPLSLTLEANGPRQFYQPAIFDGRKIEPLAWKGSADIFTLARANALLVRPENQPAQSAGSAANFLEI